MDPARPRRTIAAIITASSSKHVPRRTAFATKFIEICQISSSKSHIRRYLQIYSVHVHPKAGICPFTSQKWTRRGGPVCYFYVYKLRRTLVDMDSRWYIHSANVRSLETTSTPGRASIDATPQIPLFQSLF